MRWTDVVQASASVVSILVTLGGFFLLLRQLRNVDRTIQGDTNASLCQQSLEILNAMLSRQECYPYFYENQELPDDDPKRIQILYITEMVANYLDLVALQRTNLPTSVWNRWRNFIQDTIKASPVVRKHLTTHAHWYSEELEQLVKQNSDCSAVTKA